MATGPVEEVIWFSGGLGDTLGIVTESEHPLLGTYPRLTPMVRFSRSATVTGDAPVIGQQTIPILRELGFSDERIAGLQAAGVVGFPNA